MYITITPAWTLLFLIPSLPQPVKLLGWMMHGLACKQYIFSSPVTSIFNAMSFDVNPSTCRCEKEDKKAYWFQISHFYGSLSNDIMVMKGLKLTNKWTWTNKKCWASQTSTMLVTISKTNVPGWNRCRIFQRKLFCTYQ